MPHMCRWIFIPPYSSSSSSSSLYLFVAVSKQLMCSANINTVTCNAYVSGVRYYFYYLPGRCSRHIYIWAWLLAELVLINVCRKQEKGCINALCVEFVWLRVNGWWEISAENDKRTILTVILAHTHKTMFCDAAYATYSDDVITGSDFIRSGRVDIVRFFSLSPHYTCHFSIAISI